MDNITTIGIDVAKDFLDICTIVYHYSHNLICCYLPLIISITDFASISLIQLKCRFGQADSPCTWHGRHKTSSLSTVSQPLKNG